MRNTDKILCGILALSFGIFILSTIFQNKEKSSPKAVESAILNQKYKDDVSVIKIENHARGSSIKIERRGELHLLSAEKDGKSITAPADSTIVNSLLEKAAKIRKFYKISDKTADQEIFSVSETNSDSISFIGKDGSLYTKVRFGHSDSLTGRIYARPEGSKTIYEIEDEFRQYLSQETNYWSDGRIMGEIKNPVSVTFVREGKTALMDEKTEGFSARAGSLLSLRHGQVFPEDTTEGMRAISSIFVQDGNGRTALIKFYERIGGLGADGDVSYFYTKKIGPGETDSKETASALRSESACYEISEWTYMSLFKGS